ncbi:MAG: chemotaxis protein CheA [Halothermotrichaceae bacterium]
MIFLEDNNLLDTFIEEAGEILEKLEIDLLELENSSENKDLINEIFRSMHTLKGSAALTGLSNISDFVHHAEEVLDRIRNGKMSVNSELIELLLSSRDLVSQMVEGIYDKEIQPDINELERISRQLIAILDEHKETLDKDENTAANQSGSEDKNVQENSKKYYRIRLDLNSEFFKTGTDPLLLLKELDEIGTILMTDINLNKIPDIYNLEPELCYLYFNILLETTAVKSKLETIFMFVEIDNDITIDDLTENFEDGMDMTLADKKIGEILVERGIVAEEDIKEALEQQDKLGEILEKEGKVAKSQLKSALEDQNKSKNRKKKSTIKVNTNKLELMMNSMAELVISQAKVRELALRRAKDGERELLTALESVDNKIRSLQEEIMNVRMIPIGNTFLRFRRLVRDLARELGKEVKLNISGKNTELDKVVTEKIVDPLKHMIRNSVDHGIEAPEIREKKGKPGKGTISLNAYHQEGNIVIEIADDGQGLDPETIRKKAAVAGIISEDKQLSDEDVYQLIFEPGLSTSTEITETSGRGVGMDVVKTNIEQLRGTINIDSKKDQGTTFTIKLPLTLAIIDGMTVRIGEERYIIPLNSILEFIQPESGQIKTLYDRGEAVKVREQYITLVRLYELFNIEANYKDPTEGITVIVNNNGKKVCLLVDEILGQQQAVVKSLEDNYRYVQAIAGATILGNGQVAMILDITSIIKMAFK